MYTQRLAFPSQIDLLPFLPLIRGSLASLAVKDILKNRGEWIETKCICFRDLFSSSIQYDQFKVYSPLLYWMK